MPKTIIVTRKMLEEYVKEAVKNHVRKRLVESKEDAYMEWLKAQEAADEAFRRLQRSNSPSRFQSTQNTNPEWDSWDFALSKSNLEAGYDEWLDRLAHGYRPKPSDFSSRSNYLLWKSNFGDN